MPSQSPANHPPKPPAERKFVAVSRSIMRGAEHVATAISTTMAHRIANALNLYKPNQKGR